MGTATSTTKPVDPNQALLNALKPTAKKECKTQTDREKLLRAEQLTQKLWPIMTNMYGHKFTATFGERPHEHWIKILVGVKGDQIAEALKRCPEVFPNWPPGCAQFRSLCFGIDPTSIDKEGNDLSWQHNRLNAANQRFESERVQRQNWLKDKSAQDRAEKARQKHREAMKNIGIGS